MKRYISYFAVSLVVLGAASCKDDDKVPALDVEISSNKTVVTPGETVYFRDVTAGRPTRWDWTFEGATPETSQFYSPEVVYSQPGKYTVTLTVGRGNENVTEIFTEYIEVAYPDEMTADFTVDKENAYNTDKVTFTDTSTGFPTSWDWTFASADGRTVKSTDQNPSMMFEPGVYTVTLTVSNPKARATITRRDCLRVLDHDAIVAEFSSDAPWFILEGDQITFRDETMGEPISWAWEFEGGSPSTSTQQNPVVTYSRTGTYKVKLTARNSRYDSECIKEGYVKVVPGNDLNMYLPFDGDFNDYSGNNIAVTEVTAGSKYKVTADGESRHQGRFSARFAGESANSQTDYSFLSVSDARKVVGGNEPYTMMLWVKTDNSAQIQTLFQRGLSKGAVADNASSTNQYWCRLNKKSEGLRFYRFRTGDGSLNLTTSGTDYRDGQWHCYIFVQNDGSKPVVTAYVDGVQVARTEGTGELDTEKSPFYIGSQTQIQDGKILSLNHMQGFIDDIMMYGRAFSEDEVRALYDLTK